MPMDEKEVWKDIPGYEGKYQASTLGRVRSMTRKVKGINHYTGQSFLRTVQGRVLKPGACKTGHLYVVLGHGEAGSPVHQLVMKTFVGTPEDGQEVLHKNGDPTDNRLENLRYGSRTENILDVFNQGGKWRKLSVDEVKEIRELLKHGYTEHEIADIYGVTNSCISKIKVGSSFAWLK